MEKFEMITVGIPTFKRPKLLERAINSLLKQDNEDLQILVSINGNLDELDGYDEVQKKFKDINNIIFVNQNKKIGVINNFLYLLNKCETKYFMWLADDDELAPNSINNLLLILQGDESIITAVPNRVLVNEKIIYTNLKTYHFPHERLLTRLLSYFDASDDTFFYGLHRTKNLKKCSFNGYWWPNKLSLENWSYVFMLDILLQGKVILTNNINSKWLNHYYTPKLYLKPSTSRYYSTFIYATRRFNIYCLYSLKLIKWKKYLLFLFFVNFFLYLLIRDILFGEKVFKKLNFD